MNEGVRELGRLAQALVAEKEEEEKRLEAIIKNHSLNRRRAEGLTWSPVVINKQDFTFGGRVRIVVEKNASGGLDDAFRAGSPVHFYQANEQGLPMDAEAIRRGIIRKSTKSIVEIILDGPPIASNGLHERWTLDERADDRTFRLMAEALSHWINTENPHERHFRDVMLGIQPQLVQPQLSSNSSSEVLGLNELQWQWIEMAESAEVCSVLHGPPGTGKTTTLLAFIERAVARGERLLLCAPSNTAVDLLVMGCAERGMPLVRIGHPSRLDENIAQWGVDALVETEPDFKQVKDLRRRAESAWHGAQRFHRNFGKEQRVERTEQRREARSLQAEAADLERYIADRLIRKSPVICSTLVGAADSSLDHLKFDWVVIDEAAQALQPAAWIAFQKAEKVVLAGDPCQLPPVVKSEEANAAGLQVSALERLMLFFERGALMLTDQYRMHPKIMEPSSSFHYEGMLKAKGDWDLHQCRENPFEFVDTAGCGFDEVQDSSGFSIRNPDEAQFVIQRLIALLDVHAQSSIGIIAPYRAQSEVLNRTIERAVADQKIDPGMDITCSTVDAFQGQERDIILISLTRSNSHGVIGFLKEYRRMNVAMTRARHHLIVVGDGATLGQDDYYQALIEHAESRGAYRSAWEWMVD
ncbi:MAG: AAA domain-containing protein [Bacteroidetes bacterium]|nr:AAA domain-containing protein [Bacteroidota bacterium]MDA1336287.1 AAA domain-containing protein [Bacteroidota bacterium]